MSKKMDRSWIDDLPPDEQHALQDNAMEEPDVDGLPLAIKYYIRGPGDFVVSGPLFGRVGRGRGFPDLASAVAWAEGYYGRERILGLACHPLELNARWALVIRKK